jgi:hypothetical protein
MDADLRRGGDALVSLGIRVGPAPRREVPGHLTWGFHRGQPDCIYANAVGAELQRPDLRHADQGLDPMSAA